MCQADAHHSKIHGDVGGATERLAGFPCISGIPTPASVTTCERRNSRRWLFKFKHGKATL